MCMVTTKSMSQVMDQVFSPRLRQVQVAADNVKLAEAELVTLRAHRGESDHALQPLERSIEDAERRIEDANRRVDAVNERMRQANNRIAEINANIQAQGKHPEPKAVKRTVKATCWNKKKKRYPCNKTITEMVEQPWAGTVFVEQLAAANAERDAAD